MEPPAIVQTPVRPRDALRADAKIGAGANENLFKQTDVIHRAYSSFRAAQRKAAQVEDGVADKLPRAVVSDVSARD